MEQFTRSLSNEIRKNGLSSVVAGDRYQGTAFESQPFVHIRWAWLAFPAAMAVASGVLLAATILQTKAKGVRPWKSDVLAVLSCGIDGAVMEKAQNLEDVEAVKMLLTVDDQRAFMKMVN